MASRAPVQAPAPAATEALAAPIPSRHCETRRVRTQLKVSSPSDSAEREAVATATQVMAMPNASPLRPLAREMPLQAARAPAASTAAPGPAGTADIEAQISRARGDGRPLPASVGAFMGRRFGADFGSVRIHVDARAARLCSRLRARAFTYGRDIFFGAGQFEPDTAAGRELIAHELTHAIQQREAVQRMESDPATEPHGARPAVVRHHLAAPAVLRAAAAGATSSEGQAADPPPLPQGTEIVTEEPPGAQAKRLVVCLPLFELPKAKGAGAWVAEAYREAAEGKRLNFSPVVGGAKIRATMEEPGANYQSIWIKRHGFTTLEQIAKAFETSPDDAVKKAVGKSEVREILKGFKAGNQGGCDIDHIVEKQLGGGSIGTNLQLLTRKVNQDAGRETYARLAEIAETLMRCRPKVVELQVRYRASSSKAGDPDASFEIETLLRTQKVKGSSTAAAGGPGAPVALIAGGAREVVNLQGSGSTPIPAGAQRLVSALKLKDYLRAGGKQTQDKISADLATKPMTPGKTGVTLKAEAVSDPQGGAEGRKLTIDSHENSKVPFLIPYMSPGVLTEIKYDAQGKIGGKGTITPTVKFLGKLDVEFGPDMLKIVKGLEPGKLRSPSPKVFRFTQGNLALQLAPTFMASGSLSFTVGPAANPLILGELTARADGDAFVASGILKPARKIPGIDKAEGTVEYHSATGWSGKLTSTSSSIPGSTANLELGFTGKGGGLEPYGKGTLTTRIATTQLVLEADWNGLDLSYKGAVTVPKPLPLVKEVKLAGAYAKDTLRMSGNADIAWQQFKGSMKVAYVRKDSEANGRFSGEATLTHETEKTHVKVTLKYNEAGKLTGSGLASYQVTKDIRPELSLTLSEDGRLKAAGEVRIKDVEFGKAWPAPPNNDKTLAKGGLKLRLICPIPLINLLGEITGSLGVRYGVGPVMLKGVVFAGELYPLEKDPRVKARLKGALVVPAFGELYGTIGAFLGVEVIGGAVGVKGGIQVRPALRVQGEAGLAIDAAYTLGTFAFSAEAYAKGQMLATLNVDLKAEISAGWGLWTHEWVYNLASMRRKLGPELKITLGRIAYSPQGGMTWPSLSQIKLDPPTLNAKDLVMALFDEAREKDTKEPKRNEPRRK